MNCFLGRIAAVTLMAASPLPAMAQGYQVQPMIATMSPSGTDSTIRLLIKNTGSIPITLEMEPFRATVDAQGKPTRTPEEKDLLVFPPQTIVPPGKEQSVQVRYVGDAALSEARMYGVRVSQLPVDLSKGQGASGAGADVKVSFNFLSHLVVSPPGARSSVEVAAVARKPDGSAEMTLRNLGNAVVVLNEAKWTVTDGAGKSVDLTAEAVNAGDFSALMPKEDRRATISASQLAQLTGPVRVSLKLQ